MKTKYTTETFKKKLIDFFGPDEYTVLGEYTKSSEPIKIKHNACGKIFYPSPNSLSAAYRKRGSAICPVCNIIKNKLAQELIKTRTYNDISVISDINGMHEPVTFKHNACGYEWTIHLSTFLENKHKDCPVCSGRVVLKEEVQRRLDLITNNRLKLAEYKSISQPVKLYDVEENVSFSIPSLKQLFYANVGIKKIWNKAIKEKEYQLLLNDFMSKIDEKHEGVLVSKGQVDIVCKKCKNVIFKKIGLKRQRYYDTTRKCNVCYPEKIKVANTAELVKEKLTYYENKYEMVEDFISSKVPIKFKHIMCNTIFSQSPCVVLSRLQQNKNACPKCMGTKGVRKTNKEFQKYLDDKFGTGVYTLIEDYTDCSGYVKLMHKCGAINRIMVKTIQGKNSYENCSFCKRKRSGAEEFIENMFKTYNVMYQKEYSFKDCKDKHRLRFDFAIFKNNKLAFLLEYDGEQHFKKIKPWGGDDAYSTRARHDEIKNKYCKENDICLERIPFTVPSLKDTIISLLKKYNIL